MDYLPPRFIAVEVELTRTFMKSDNAYLAAMCCRVEGGYLWESGQKGPLLRQAKVDYSPASNIKMTSAVTKSNGVQRLKKKEKIRVKMLTEATKSPPASEVVSRCGQCEKSTASLVS